MTDVERAAASGPPFASPPVRRPPASAPSTRMIVVALTIGLLLLAVFVAVVTTVGDRNDALRRDGIRVSGVVTKLTADSGLHPGRIWVSYPVDGRTLVGSVDAGSDVSKYHVGEAVTVYYDVRHPSQMTTEEEDNQSGWSVELSVFMLVFGVISLGLGFAGIAIRLIRRRRRSSGAQTAPTGRHSAGRIVAGRPSPLTALIGAAGVGFTAVMTVTEARSGSVSLARALRDAAGSGALAAALFLFASCHVSVGRRDMRVVNPATTTVIPLTAIVRLDASEGLVVRLHDGRRVSSFALGDSLAGQLLGQQRAHAAVRRYQAWLSVHQQSDTTVGPPVVRRRIRLALMCAPVWPAAYALAAAAIHAIRF